MDRNARDFEDLARGKKQYDTDGQPTGHINLFRNDANSTKWVSAGGTADVSAGTADPTGFSETTFLSSNYALLHRINSRYRPQDYSRNVGLLGTGGYFNAIREKDRQEALQSKCINSNSCAAGYSCISGQCTRIWGKDPSNVDSCGSLSVNWPCASVSNPGTSKCGNNNGAGSCQEQICGTGVDSRCCRAAGDGQVNCFCRACGNEGQCSPFCDAYNKTHGKAGPGCTPAGGVSAGFCNKDICSECQTCTAGIFGGGYQCQVATSGVPCWCEGQQCDGNNCEKCVKDKDSSDYGQCEYSWEDCADCCTIYNYECVNCNQIIPFVQHCEPHVNPNEPSIRESCYIGARRKAAEICSQACGDPGGGGGGGGTDPCVPKCSTATYCTDTHPEVTECPAGSVQTGVMTVGTNTCIFCETCDESELPDSCKACDCNCHNDCPPCQLCGADGKCYPDPTCNICGEGETLCSDLETCCPANTTCSEEYVNVFNMGGGFTATIRTAGPPQWSVVGPGYSECSENICSNNGEPRPHMIVSNRSDTGTSVCDGGTLGCVSFYDSVCWPGGVASPTLVSSQIESSVCCPAT